MTAEAVMLGYVAFMGHAGRAGAGPGPVDRPGRRSWVSSPTWPPDEADLGDGGPAGGGVRGAQPLYARPDQLAQATPRAVACTASVTPTSPMAASTDHPAAR